MINEIMGFNVQPIPFCYSAYQNNAIKKDPTGGHTTIKALLYEEIKKILEWGIDKYVGKKLTKNVSAYVKRHHPYIYNTNFLEQGEEESARKTIREYLYRYILERDTDDSDLSDSEDKAGNPEMTYVTLL